MDLNLLGGNVKIRVVAMAALLALMCASLPISAQQAADNEESETEISSNLPDDINNEGLPFRGKSIIKEGSPGMYIPMDGKSVRAFEKSMEEVQAQVTPQEFTTIQNSLEYLLVYDLAARRDEKRLYKNLDGMTAAEIVQSVKWRLEGRGRYSREQ